MKNWRIFLLFVITLLAPKMYAGAITIYRQVPFSLHINENNSIIVNYDFTGKTGIYCTSNDHESLMDFVYKGHRKSAHLPIKLQSDHVPDEAGEALADVNGQFSILISQHKTWGDREVKCYYSHDK